MAVDRYPTIKYYAERVSKGNISIPITGNKGKFIRLVWPTLAISPTVSSPNSIKANGSVALEIGNSRIIYALAASPQVTWKIIFQDPAKENTTDPDNVVDIAADVADGDKAIITMMRRGRAQIYFYDKYKKSYYGAYILVNFRILPEGPHSLYVSSANGSPQSVKLTCYGYPGTSETWSVTDYRICTASPTYTTTNNQTGVGTIVGKNSSITFTAAYKGSTTVSYSDQNGRSAINTVIINVLDGADPPPLQGGGGGGGGGGGPVGP